MNRLIIGAPFGNYFNVEGVLSTIGTFTYHYRAGFWKRLWRVMKTVRYNRRQQSWINKLGLPNPSLTYDIKAKGKIVSIHGFNSKEWLALAMRCESLQPYAVELNLSCPNVMKIGYVTEVEDALEFLLRIGFKVIAKLPPIRWNDLAIPLYNLGCRYFHCCNTIATPGGGISGKPLKQYSLWAVEELRILFPDIVIIGGGGITDLQDIKDYINAGANSVSIASMLFNPLNWRKVKQFRDYLEPEGYIL